MMQPHAAAAQLRGGGSNYVGGEECTIGGGGNNEAVGENCTIGGGHGNEASGWYSTIAGGWGNEASVGRSTVGGGTSNVASAWHSTSPGGLENQAGGELSFAAGHRAKVRDAAASGDPDGDEGTFVWADSTSADFTSTGPDQFLIRAAGGVGIGTEAPLAPLHIDTDQGVSYPNLVARFEGSSGGANPYSLDFTATGINAWSLTDPNNPGDAPLHLNHQSAGDVRIAWGGGGVGIGVLFPTERLDVNGTARLRDIQSGSGTTVVADTNGRLWKQSSSLRYKTNVRDLPGDPQAALELRPVAFDWRSTGESEVGLIAEEVADVLPELVLRDAEGRPDAVRYDKLALYLLEVVKQQQTRIALLEESAVQNQSLRARVEALEQVAVQHRVRSDICRSSRRHDQD